MSLSPKQKESFYQPNSDSESEAGSGGSSPLLPFRNGQTAPVDDPWAEEGDDDDEAGSPDYGAGQVEDEDQPVPGTVEPNGKQDEEDEVSGRARKRIKLDEEERPNEERSLSQSHQENNHSNQQANDIPHDPSAPMIPFPHQLPLPDHSKSLYLSSLAQHASSLAPSGGPMKPYHPVPRVIMHSLFGFTPRNEVGKEVGEWLMGICANLPGNIEIEIKFGQITQKGHATRLRLPVKTETLIDESMIEVGFKSDMPIEAHSALNKILNEQTSMSAQPGGHPTHPPHSYHRLNYSHTRTTDYSYPASAAPGKNSIPQPLFTSRFGFGKRRVSKSAGPARGGQPAEEKVVDCIQKVKIGHLHVYCPLESFDFRISVNCEFPCELPPMNEPYENVRKKDRISYKHSLFQVDLTQVRSFTPRGTGGDMTHELELEILDARKLLSYGFNASQGHDPENRWEESLDSVLNTVRLMNKNVVLPPFVAQGMHNGGR